MTYIFKILIKKTKIFSFFFILLFIMPSCSKKVKSYGYIKTKINNQYQIDYSEYVLSPSQKDLIISFSEIPQNLNPYRANSSAELFFKQALFSSIFYLDPKSEIPTKNLIDKYFVSYDGLEYNFTLKDNVKFSNGTKLNSDDVIASLSLLDTILKDTSLYNNFYILNKKLEAEKLSSLKFTISTDKPNANIAYALSNFPIIPKIIAEKITENIEEFINYWDIFKNNQIIGSGPYILEKIDDNEAIFVKNPYYFKVDSKNNRLPYTERIIVKFYKGKNKEILGFINGESDVLSLQTHDYHNLYQYYNKSNVQSVKFIDTNFSLNRILVVYNCYNEDSKSYLKDLSFREYISSFISDEGSKHNDFFIDSSTKYGSNLSSNADSLLKDLNYDGILEYKDGNTVFLRIIVPKEDMQLVKIAEIATLTLKELNMDVFLEKIPYHLFLERLFYTKDYDIAFSYYSFYPGVISYLSLLNKEKLSFFPYIIDNNKTSNAIDNFLENCVYTTSIKKQIQEIKKVDKLLKKKYQLYPIFMQKKYYLIKGNIYNFKINSSIEESFNLKTIETIVKITE